MSKASYSEKLRDPRWQKLRLKIFEKNEFLCEDCGEQDKELHVHHSYYEKSKEPWESKECYLKCLCYECHKLHGEHLDFIKEAMGRMNAGDLVTLEWTAMWLANGNCDALNALQGCVAASIRMKKMEDK